jgi:succinate dehydrogenase / fumarate reductase cytochrome b subunit
MHLYHGIQSFFQTIGQANDSTLPPIMTAGRFVALVLFLGFASIPLSLLLGIIKG